MDVLGGAWRDSVVGTRYSGEELEGHPKLKKALGEQYRFKKYQCFSEEWKGSSVGSGLGAMLFFRGSRVCVSSWCCFFVGFALLQPPQSTSPQSHPTPTPRCRLHRHANSRRQ